MKNSLSYFLVFFSFNAFCTTPLPEILQKLQSSWDEAKTYQADFKQVIFAKRLGTRDESTGIVSVVKPGKLRWETPLEKSVQILNGKKLINIRENRRRKTTVVDIYADVSKSMDLKSLNFLSGKARFKESYKAELVNEGAEKIELKLIPLADSTDSYIAEIDKKSYFLRALTTETADTRVRIDFSNTKANVELKNSLFEYKPNPKDSVHNNP